MTRLTQSPTLTRLFELTYHWRKVAILNGSRPPTWFGDLDLTAEQKVYQTMLWEQRTLTQVTHYPTGERPVLFARIAPGFDPQAAYNGAVRFLHASGRRLPGVRVEGSGMVKGGRVR